MDHFKLHSEYKPTGDQPQAIEKLVKGFQEGNQFETLLGVTGSGKIFTMANVIAQLNKPTLVLAHNKTLAAQLYGEFKEFFPENAVEYFVSYYDYYQPEAYVPSSDTYIAKDSSINDEIDKLRLSATTALAERRDVIIISSVSCIYGLGSPVDYKNMVLSLRPGMERDRDEVIHKLIDLHYDRNDMDFHRGTFRVHGDVLEIFPAESDEYAYRVEFFGDEIDRITEIDVLTGKSRCALEHIAVFPASHYVVPMDKILEAAKHIEEELDERVRYFKREDKLIEAQRIAERTNFDIEMLKETGFCSGIENYSRHLSGLEPGATPHTLMDYFPDDFLIIIDESHKTVPQIGAMYAGDQSRKSTLVDYGFRLPSAKDNRPLNFEEKGIAAYQKYLKDYLRTVAAIDESVGQLINTLEEDGSLENTIVIYTSDQGIFLGEHDYQDKRWSFEESLRTPFLIRYPKEIQAGSVCKALMANIDVAPTLLDYAGIEIPEEMQGVSGRKVIAGEEKEIRDAVYFRYWMHLAHNHDNPAHYGIRTKRYKLTFYYGLPLDATGAVQKETPPGWELYDLERDPQELHNVYEDIEYQEVCKRLKVKLENMKKFYRDTDEEYPVLLERYKRSK